MRIDGSILCTLVNIWINNLPGRSILKQARGGQLYLKNNKFNMITK